MAQVSEVELGESLGVGRFQPFCSYCGYPPTQRWRERAHRVCRRCQLGVVLQAPVRAAPHHGDLFLILDQQLMVQGVSRGAEELLLVEEPTWVGGSLSDWLVCADGNARYLELTRLVTRAVAGKPSPDTVELRTAGQPLLWFEALVSVCGPPTAALLTLTPNEPVRHLSD